MSVSKELRKAGQMRSFNAETIRLDHFMPRAFYYPPTGMGVSAFLVTEENLGALAVEFESDLYYRNSDPYFILRAERESEHVDAQPPVINIAVQVGCWIVSMYGCLYMFHDVHFKKTFAEAVQANLDPLAATWMDQEIADQERAYGELREGPDPLEMTPKPFTVPRETIEKTILGDPAVLGVPTPHPRDTEIGFKKGAKVTDPENRAGEVVEGPNGRNEYFVTLEEGGATWYHAADLRLNMGPRVAE